MVIKSIDELELLKKVIHDNAEKTVRNIKRNIGNCNAVVLLETLKFDKTGFDPLTGKNLNFIEQLNQTFSNLVVLEGARQLLELYPGIELTLNMGTTSGFDIEATNEDVVAECFAVTTATSNQKLIKDCEKLLNKAQGKKKYIFFYSRYDADDKLLRICDKYPNISIRRVLRFE